MNQGAGRRCFILSTVFTSGDIYPFARIGRELLRRGHRVILVTHEHFRGLAERHGLEFAPIDDEVAYQRFLADSRLFGSPNGIRQVYQRHILPTVLTEYRAIAEAARTQDTIVVARSAPQIAARMAAADFGIPFVSVYLAPNGAATVGLLGRLLDSVLAPDVAKLRAALERPPIEGSWALPARHALALWPPWYGEVQLEGAAEVALTGFVMGDAQRDRAAPAELTELLAAGPPPVLATAGTGVFFDSKYLELCAAACDQLGRRCVLVAEQEAMVPRGLAAQHAWFKWLPFQTVFPEMAAVMHHGGIGTASDGLAAGVPHVVMGSGVDRPDNAARLERLGVGRYVPPGRWSVGAIAEALDAVLRSEEVARACKLLAGRMAESNGAVAAADALEAWFVRGSG